MSYLFGENLIPLTRVWSYRSVAISYGCFNFVCEHPSPKLCIDIQSLKFDTTHKHTWLIHITQFITYPAMQEQWADMTSPDFFTPTQAWWTLDWQVLSKHKHHLHWPISPQCVHAHLDSSCKPPKIATGEAAAWYKRLVVQNYKVTEDVPIAHWRPQRYIVYKVVLL